MEIYFSDERDFFVFFEEQHIQVKKKVPLSMSVNAARIHFKWSHRAGCVLIVLFLLVQGSA